MFTENKITEFTNKISALADRPQMSAQALKAYFDASAEELRVKHNALIDALSAFAGNSFPPFPTMRRTANCSLRSATAPSR